MGPRNATPLRTAAQGLAAGAIGTALMTGWQQLTARLQSSGGGEQGGGEEPQTEQEAWEQAPTPAQAGAKVSEAVAGRRPPAEGIPALTQALHWAYGTSWGAVYGAVRSAAHGDGNPVRDGALFGAAVWAASYAQLVPMGLYQPPWKYPPKELAMDLSHHVVYGLGVAAGHRALARG